MRADPPPPRRNSGVQSVEAEAALGALETELKQLLAELGIRACAMRDHEQDTYPVHVYAVPEPHIVEPDPHVTGLPWHGLLGYHDATRLETALDHRGSRLGTRLVGATFQVVVRPAWPRFVDVRFRPTADLHQLSSLVQKIGSPLGGEQHLAGFTAGVVHGAPWLGPTPTESEAAELLHG